MIRACQMCGRMFDALTKKTKYCSDRCRKKRAYYTPQPLRRAVCRECHKIFHTRRSDKVYCSVQCKEKHNDTSRTVPRICRHCGSKFETTKAFQYYCDHDCYVAAKRKRDADNLRRIRNELSRPE